MHQPPATGTLWAGIYVHRTPVHLPNCGVGCEKPTDLERPRVQLAPSSDFLISVFAALTPRKFATPLTKNLAQNPCMVWLIDWGLTAFQHTYRLYRAFKSYTRLRLNPHSLSRNRPQLRCWKVQRTITFWPLSGINSGDGITQRKTNRFQ